MARSSARGHSVRLRRAVALGALAVLVAGGGVAARAAGGTPVATYRVGQVTRGSVQQLLDLSGAAQQVNQESATFAVSGTVTSLTAAVGNHVMAGQRIATIDPTPLKSALVSDQAALAQAKAQLAADQVASTNAQNPSVQTSSVSPSSAAPAQGSALTSGADESVNPAVLQANPFMTGALVAPVSFSAPNASAPKPTGPFPTTGRPSPTIGRSSQPAGSSSSAVDEQFARTAQERVDTDLRQVLAELATQQRVCALVLFPAPTPAPTSAPTPMSTPPPMPSPPTTIGPPTATSTTLLPSPSTPPTRGVSTGDLTACVAALQTTATAQRQLATDQEALATAQSSLGAALAASKGATQRTQSTQSTQSAAKGAKPSRASSGPSSSGAPSHSSSRASSHTAAGSSGGTGARTSGPGSGSTTPARRSAGSGSAKAAQGGTQGTSSSGGSGPDAASRVTNDQAAVAVAESALTAAQANLQAATLDAPITGTVASVSFTVGSPSSRNAIVIVGKGAMEVDVQVPLSSMPQVRVGLPALISSPGATSTVDGTVKSISLLPTSNNTGNPTYAAVVVVPQPGAGLASGAQADASLILATVHGVLAVPNSAVTNLVPGSAFVTTLKNGTPTRIAVKVGAVGQLATQVISGLTLGQQVVLADLSQPLPTGPTNLGRLGGGLGASSSGKRLGQPARG